MSKIKITFPDGNIKEFDKGVTGYEIAESISPRLAKETLAVRDEWICYRIEKTDNR